MNIVLNYNQFLIINSDKNKFADWNNILKMNNVEIYLSMNDDEVKILLDTNSNIFKLMLNSNNSKPFKKFNNEINIDKKPSYILFDEKFCSNNNGNLIIDKETLVNPFKLSYAKSLEKNDKIEYQSKKGWKLLFENKSLESNALIINDSYIFDDKENQTRIGSKNLIDLIDAILPNNLDVSYHILINTTTSKNKTNTFYDSFIPALITDLSKLRNYEIKVEFVIGESFHKRKLYTNFLNVTTDKGFKIFDKRDNSKVLDHNDITIETMFTRNDPNQGDSQYDEMKIRIKELSKLIKSFLDWINAETYNNTRSFYYSNLEKQEKIEIINRLIF